MEPLKEMFNSNYYENLSREILRVDSNFDRKGFVKEATKNLSDLSLNQRMRNTSVVLKDFFGNDYLSTIEIFKRVIKKTPRGYTNLVFPDFVSLYGHDNVEASLEALRYFTSYGSSEFAIREFLKRDFQKTLKYMMEWSKDPDHHVRRLASEGSRPRLPWSFKLDEVIKNPSVTASILENLKCDNELYVRKSVANHLNDISKENSDYMIRVLKSWDSSDPRTAWIIRHASRTLVKKGNKESLSIFNYEKNPKINIQHFKILTPKIKLGDYLQFSFDILSASKKDQKLVVDYVIHYVKKGGTHSAKVFKLKDLVLKPGEKVRINRKQMMKDFTTRKHFKGTHYLEIQVNGKIVVKGEFVLTV